MLPLLLLAALPPSQAPSESLATSAPLISQVTTAPTQAVTIAQANTGPSAGASTAAQSDQSSNDDHDGRRYPYASLQLGVAFPNDLNGHIGALDTDTTLRLDSGFNGELAVGYKFNDIRTDLSVGYGTFAVNSQSYSTPGIGSATIGGKGAVNLWTVMANAYYDVPIWGDPAGNKLRFSLGIDTTTANNGSVDTASADADYSSRIEIWDPTANDNQGAWVPYVADSFYKVPGEREGEREHASVVLVRVPINRDSTPDNGETLTLTAVNGAGDRGRGTAVIRDDGSGTVFVTSADRSGVLAPTPVQLRRPESSNSTTTADRANDSSLDPAVVDPALLPADGDGQPRGMRRPVIRVSRPVVSENSPYVVFSVFRDQLPSRWGPYVGAGIGYANLGTPACAASNCYSGGSAGSFAWQAKLGVAYRATERGSAFLEGGYVGTAGNNSIDDVTFNSFGAWRVNVGWRQGF